MKLTNNYSIGTLTTLALCGSVAIGEVPSYSVEVVATYTQTTTVRGASEAGHIVGDQVVGGFSRAFIATLDDGLIHLPLPNGATSSVAFDVNSAGIVVGSVHGGGFVFDGGEPAIWMPDGIGGYTAHIPEQFETQPSPLGELSINGGMATSINEDGTIVGWSRYQGFQGGPTTVFSIDQSPINLNLLGFEATIRDINNNGVIVGGNYMFDLNSSTATHIGIPDEVGTVGFTHVIGYAINDSNEVVAAAHRATAGNDAWLTYLYDGSWSPLNPSQLASPFVGFYDNNNLGDVSASGGVYFAAEDALVLGYSGLIVPEDQRWSVALGYIGDNRNIYSTAYDAGTNTSAVVILVADAGLCAADMTGDGVLDFFDISEFLTLFGSSDPAADMNSDGMFDFFDISAFLTAFSAGCP